MPVQTAIADKAAAKLTELAAQLETLEADLADPAIASDHRRAADLAMRRAALAPAVFAWREHQAARAEAAELRAALGSSDADLATLAAEELPGVEARAEAALDRAITELVQSDDRSVGSVILEIRAGTGGDEAALWARDLLSVYARYAARVGWKIEEMELDAESTAGGVRRAVVNIAGEGVWQKLAFEAGVHSVKRVPATETQGRIHTSTCTVAVLPEPKDVEVHIDWASDVVEHVTTSQGPGGQNVNKVATAVNLVHTPTGIEVRMQETKSQQQNRERARRLLRARVYEHERAKVDAARAAERKTQIGSGQRSEKIRTYRYQDNIVADERLDAKLTKSGVVDAADLDPMFEALIAQDTARRLAEL